MIHGIILIMVSRIRHVPKSLNHLKLIIGDLSGTFVDPYSMGPAVAFQKVFAKYGVPITTTEARGPMGHDKREHINRLLIDPIISYRWYLVYKRNPNKQDINKLYDDLAPIMMQVLPDHCQVIPGVIDTLKILRKSYGLKIGCTTGYNRAMADIVIDQAHRQGLVLDSVVTSDDVHSGGRPGSAMIAKNMDLNGITSVYQCLKVGDTRLDCQEGKNGGCWTALLAAYSNELMMDHVDSEPTIQKLNRARSVLSLAGPDYIANIPNELPAIVDCINTNLTMGELPGTHTL